VIAKEDIKRPIPNTVGSFEYLYRKGDVIRDEDMESLGLVPPPRSVPPVQDKARRGPREVRKGPASRDQALTGPKEE